MEEKKAFEPTGLVPRSIVRTFERFRQQLLPGSEAAAIREYRISRYQVLVSARCLFALLTIPIATNWVVSNWLLSPVIEHFWNTQQNEIFLNSYQEERAFAELEFFSEKLFFESLISNINFNDISPKVIEWSSEEANTKIPSGRLDDRRESFYLSQLEKSLIPVGFTPAYLSLSPTITSDNTSFEITEGEKGDVSLMSKSITEGNMSYNYKLRMKDENLLTERITSEFLPLYNLIGYPVGFRELKSSPKLGPEVLNLGFSGGPALQDNLFFGENLFNKGDKTHDINTPRLISSTQCIFDASCALFYEYQDTKPSALYSLSPLKKPFEKYIEHISITFGNMSFGNRNRQVAMQLPILLTRNETLSQQSPETMYRNFSEGNLIAEVNQSEDSLKIKEKIQEKILELAVYYNQQTILSITNVIGDLVSVITLGCLFIWLKPEITILKSFLIEAIYSLSDTTKSFLLILLTDLLVGFHSPRGWETALELLLKHFGLPENQDFVFLFVATFPVLLDTVFKYWIFRHLNKISPSTVATYHSMIE